MNQRSLASGGVALGPSAHTDTFARDNLPPQDQWPDFLLDGFEYPDFINAGVELTDRLVEQGLGDRTALIGNGRRRTYKELADWTNRLANALVENYGVKPGNRVLIRSANNPAMVACWLAASILPCSSSNRRLSGNSSARSRSSRRFALISSSFTLRSCMSASIWTSCDGASSGSWLRASHMTSITC